MMPSTYLEPDLFEICNAWGRDTAGNFHPESEHTVFVLDDDIRVLETVSELFRTEQIHAVVFNKYEEYRKFPKPNHPTCLVLDMELSHCEEFEPVRGLVVAHRPQIVFLTESGNVPATVSAIKAGAVDVFQKPFHPEELLEAVRVALRKDAKERTKRADRAQLEERLLRLTPRERQVLPFVVSGLLNKQSAAELGISEVTLQIHRSKIMQKMAAQSLCELVRMAFKLKISLISRSAYS